jgi:putative transposase
MSAWNLGNSCRRWPTCESMTVARQIVAGWLYLLTRRCTQRQFLLRPDVNTNAIFEYCLAEAAARYGIELLAWTAMSNHYHAVVHDPFQKLPAFLEQFHKMVAKALNRRWDRWENLWSTTETCVTRLVTANDVFEKVVYVLCNPMNANLVDQLAHWPGSCSMRQMLGTVTSQERPRQYFDPKGKMPSSLELRVVAPPSSISNESPESWVARVCRAVAEREKELREQRQRDGKQILGRKAVLAAKHTDTPSSPAPRRRLRPRLACKERELRERAIEEYLGFLQAYSVARLAFIGRDYSTVFPFGTYRFRLLGAKCESVPIAA